MKINILTIFPQLFDSFLSETLINKAQERGLIDIRIHDIRSFASDKHKQVDDRPFGGGPGMVLMIEPLYKALLSLDTKDNLGNKKVHTILMSPTGTQFTQKKAQEYAVYDELRIIAGRYEGVDARIEEFVDEQISIGPYIVSGGEVPAMIITEAVSRNIPGVLGNQESLKHLDKGSMDIRGEYPVYTRPEVFITEDGKKMPVPPVLLGGNHKEIDSWREIHTRSVDQ